ncbi:hypothetical protein [Cryptosporangium japonicum]|uniref:hypothetical protein n=1 Tax=Cryptosporangium japonicum TaxID=80872 RepID=UPI0031D0FB87
MLTLTIGTAIGAARGSCRCASALAVLGVVWILANGPMEGHVLWTLDSEHGLTSADLITIPMFTLAGWRLWRSAEVQCWLAGRGQNSLTHAGVRGRSRGPRSLARLTAAPPVRRMTTARGVTRRRSAASIVRLSTGGPGGASGD